MARNIAVALIGAIGDVILSTPLLQALRDGCPDARITYMVGTTSAPVVYGLNCFDDIILIDDRPNPGLSSTADLLRQVVRAKIDVSISLSRSNRLSSVFWAARVPRRIGFTPLRTSYLLTDEIYSYGEPQGSAHRTRYFLAAAEALGIPQPKQVELQYRISESEGENARNMLRVAGVDPTAQRIVGIHPGTSRINMEKRRWSSTNFIEVARQLGSRGYRILLFGGPDEIQDCQAIAQALGPAAIDFSGKLELRQFAAVLKNCHVLINLDSSPLHLAGAIGVPVVGIFGHNNQRLWGPLDSQSRVVRLDLPCSPCTPDFVCGRSFECIRTLPVSDVIEAVESILDTLSGVRTV